jgi:iron complex outermembrane receptor protein
VSAGLLSLHKDLTLEPTSTDPAGVDNPNLSNDPDYQVMLRASVDLGSNHQLDMIARHVATLPNPVVPNYTAIDLRYAWRARPELEVSLVLHNAFDGEHAEFNEAPARSEIASDVYGQVRWSF